MNAELSEILKRTAGQSSPQLSVDDAAVLREALRKYPYFVAPAVILLRAEGVVTDSDEEKRLRGIVAMASSPSAAASRYAAYGPEWSQFYPAPRAAGKPGTIDAIDTFLKTYGSTSPEEEKLLEKLIFNPTPDYAEMLAREEQENLPDPEDASPGGAPADPQQERINAFILSQHPASPHQEHPLRQKPAPEPVADSAPVVVPEHTDDSLLSESLAKIFIKQGRYERAYEIISNLSLKYPKKSVYFADQLRFLRKLIINQRHKDRGSKG